MLQLSPVHLKTSMSALCSSSLCCSALARFCLKATAVSRMAAVLAEALSLAPSVSVVKECHFDGGDRIAGTNDGMAGIVAGGRGGCRVCYYSTKRQIHGKQATRLRSLQERRDANSKRRASQRERGAVPVTVEPVEDDPDGKGPIRHVRERAVSML